MKTFLWVCIVILGGMIGLVLYADYNPRLASFLCNRVSYCRDTTHNNIINNEYLYEVIETVDIIYTTGTEFFDVGFYLDDPQQNLLFDEYSKINSSCEVDGSYMIGGGPGCSHITGFTHTYTYPKLGLSFLAYGGIMGNQSIIDNPGLLTPYLKNPFSLSNNNISVSWSQGENPQKETVSYKEFQSGENIDTIISNAIIQQLDGIPYYSHREIKPGESQQFQNTDFVVYSINYLDRKNNRNRNNLYIFKPGKVYYYVLDRESYADCIPVGCGYDQHKITYFLK